MNKSILLVVAAAIAIAVSDSRGSTQGRPSRTGTGQVGRYQLVTSLDGRIFLLDTATGQCWSRTPGGDWRDEGNPTQTKARKPEQQAKRSAPTLDLPEKSVEMTVVQREERAIPGSDGSVRIQVGDITEGQVLLAVVTGDDYLLERTSVSQGHKVEFSVGKKRYRVHIKELRNILIGDDFVKITVAEATEGSSPEERRSPEQKR